MRQVIEQSYDELLSALLALGFNPNIKPSTTSPSLMDVARQLNQSKIVRLLHSYQITESPILAPRRNQLIYLVVMDQSRRHILLAKKRRHDNSMSSLFQLITTRIDQSLTFATLQDALYQASTIKVNEQNCSWRILGIVGEDALEHVIVEMTLQGRGHNPLVTKNWASLQ